MQNAPTVEDSWKEGEGGKKGEGGGEEEGRGGEGGGKGRAGPGEGGGEEEGREVTSYLFHTTTTNLQLTVSFLIK